MSKFDKISQRANIHPLADLNPKNVAAGLVSSLLAITGPPAIILQAASNGHFTSTQTVHWMFSVYVLGGILSILLPLYYRIPIVGAHSITGVAFLATVTSQFTYHQLLGTYLISGLFLLLVGYFRIFSKLIDYVPKPILAAMLAGMITKYMVSFIISINSLAFVGGTSLIAFLIFSRWIKRIPPIVGAIFTGFILLILTQPLKSGGVVTSFVFPQLLVPEFNLPSIFSVSLPLALLILSNDVAVGIGALEQNGYKPATNQIIFLSGIFSLFASFLGGQSANIGGMMSAICSDEEAGPKEQRYMGSVVSGIIILLFGLFAWRLVPLIQTLPHDFVSILVGFALINVFGNSLSMGFSQPTMKLSVAFSFIVAISNVTILGLSAPVWSLVIGTLIARLIEDKGGVSKKEGSSPS